VRDCQKGRAKSKKGKKKANDADQKMEVNWGETKVRVLRRPEIRKSKLPSVGEAGKKKRKNYSRGVKKGKNIRRGAESLLRSREATIPYDKSTRRCLRERETKGGVLHH